MVGARWRKASPIPAFVASCAKTTVVARHGSGRNGRRRPMAWHASWRADRWEAKGRWSTCCLIILGATTLHVWFYVLWKWWPGNPPKARPRSRANASKTAAWAVCPRLRPSRRLRWPWPRRKPCRTGLKKPGETLTFSRMAMVGN